MATTKQLEASLLGAAGRNEPLISQSATVVQPVGPGVIGSTSVIILGQVVQFFQVSRYLGMNIHKPRDLGLLRTLLEPQVTSQGWVSAGGELFIISQLSGSHSQILSAM